VFRVALLVVIGHAPYPELTKSFVATQNRILEFLQRHTAPFIAKAYRPSTMLAAENPNAAGRIELWYPS
jgi:hypothetical protein